MITRKNKLTFKKHSIKSALRRRPILSARDDAESLLKNMMPHIGDEVDKVESGKVYIKTDYPLYGGTGYFVADIPFMVIYDSHNGELLDVIIREKDLRYSMEDLFQEIFNGIDFGGMSEEEFNEITPEEAIEIGKDEFEAFMDYMYDTYSHIDKAKFVRLVKQYMEEEGIVESSFKIHRRFKNSN